MPLENSLLTRHYQALLTCQRYFFPSNHCLLFQVTLSFTCWKPSKQNKVILYRRIMTIALRFLSRRFIHVKLQRFSTTQKLRLFNLKDTIKYKCLTVLTQYQIFSLKTVTNYNYVFIVISNNYFSRYYNILFQPLYYYLQINSIDVTKLQF